MKDTDPFIGTWYVMTIRDSESRVELPQIVCVQPDGTFCLSTLNNTVSTGFGSWFKREDGSYTTLSTYFRTFQENDGSTRQYWAAGMAELNLSEDLESLEGDFQVRRFNLTEPSAKVVEVDGSVQGSMLLPSTDQIKDVEKFVKQWMDKGGPPFDFRPPHEDA